MPLVVALILLPAIEITALALVGSLIGIWPALALVFTGSAAGLILLKRQGLEIGRGGLHRLDRGSLDLVVGQACLFLAGLLLLVPGLVTDVAAILLLLPPVRRLIGTRLVDRLRRQKSVRVILNGEPVGFGWDDGPTRPTRPQPRPNPAMEAKAPQEPGPAAGPDGDEPPEVPPDGPPLSQSRWRSPGRRARRD